MVEIAPSCSSECCEEVDIVSSSSSDSNQTCTTHPSRHVPSEMETGGTCDSGTGLARESGNNCASVNPTPHCVAPSSVERTIQRQRLNANVTTPIRPAIAAEALSSIY